MEINTKVSGRPVSDMDKAVILLLEEMFMSESRPGERLKDMVSTLGITGTHTPVSFTMDRKTDKGTGRKVAILTQTNTVANTKMIKNMVMVNFPG